MPQITFANDFEGVDIALFVIQTPSDLPNMPELARVIDGIPRERRIIVDLWGRYNDTIRVDGDFNHLEKLDGHLGWEWIEAFDAISNRILQPTYHPLKEGVQSFLFHGYESSEVIQPYSDAGEAARAWHNASECEKSYGILYIGNNWQRWSQLIYLFNELRPIRSKVGPIGLIGWNWDQRPDWAIYQGISGVDTDPAALSSLEVQIQSAVRFDQVIGLMSCSRFVPVIHRPLFRHLGYVTNRTFETFCANTLPILLLPHEFVESVYGPDALKLIPGEDVANYINDTLRDSESYWDAVLKTRERLAKHHSFDVRFQELRRLTDSTTISATGIKQ